MKKIAQKTISAFALLLSFLVFTSPAFAAAPDVLGPWADSVVTFHQGLEANGNPVPAIRSNSSAALGVAEGTLADGTFVSLGFGGALTLGFDNGIAGGSMVVESTNPGYPIETAKVELSADGTNWFMAGNVSQTGTVSQPEGLPCAKFARITDTSNPSNFVDKSADGYDVDGVKAVGRSCTVACNGTCGCDSDISQTNNTSTTTIVQSGANTGKNKITDNTGGSNTVTTGSANNTTNITIGGSSNTVTGGTGCCNGSTNVNISGNGKGSTNIVNVNSIKAPTPPPVISLKKVH